jgi:G3E family GTPase
MKITQIAGFLGCGKTTLLLKLSRVLLGENERKVALVVNEIGEIPVDGKIMEESGMQVKDIGGGCICQAWLGGMQKFPWVLP